MTDTRSLDRSRWTTALGGHQYEAERLPFSYLGHDPKDDVVIVAVGGRSSRFLDQEDTPASITFFPAAAAG